MRMSPAAAKIFVYLHPNRVRASTKHSCVGFKCLLFLHVCREYITWRFVLMYFNLKPQIQGSLSLLEGRLWEDVRMPVKQASTELD